MRPIFTVYLLGLYILLQFCWWTYLLVELNNEVYEHRIENVRLSSFTPQNAEAELKMLEHKMKLRHWMVIGEGCVFLGFLFWGSALTLRSIRKEVLLAQMQKNFLLSITHEFKSPLASIKLFLQTLLKHDLDKDKQIKFINGALSDTDRLNSLVENTLLANLLDHEGYHFNMEELNFSALVRLQVQKFQSVPDRNHVEMRIEDNLFMDGDVNALTMLIQNLLENAMKYSPYQNPIGVELHRVNNKIQLSIKDLGIGVPDSEKQKIFEKFYRIGNEETRKTKGTGLGLFIVDYIVKGHKGNVFVQNNIPQGSIFVVELTADPVD